MQTTAIEEISTNIGMAKMEDHPNTTTTYGEHTFDPKDYINRLKQSPDDSNYGRVYHLNAKFHHEIFQRGDISGDRVLDVGSGPTWFMVYAASKWFREITLSDLFESNVTELRNWKDGKEEVEEIGLIKYMLKLDGQGEDYATASENTRQKVKHIVQVDARKEPFLVSTEVKGVMYDAIMLTLAQFNISSGYDETLRFVKSYSKQLRVGGHVVVCDTLDTSRYKIGPYTYRRESLPKKTLCSLFESCGYEVVHWDEAAFRDESFYDDGDADGTRSFCLVCKKLALFDGQP